MKRQLSAVGIPGSVRAAGREGRRSPDGAVGSPPNSFGQPTWRPRPGCPASLKDCWSWATMGIGRSCDRIPLPVGTMLPGQEPYALLIIPLRGRILWPGAASSRAQAGIDKWSARSGLVQGCDATQSVVRAGQLLGWCDEKRSLAQTKSASSGRENQASDFAIGPAPGSPARSGLRNRSCVNQAGYQYYPAKLLCPADLLDVGRTNLGINAVQ